MTPQQEVTLSVIPRTREPVSLGPLTLSAGLPIAQAQQPHMSHMNKDQLDCVKLAARVILAGPAATYSAEELAKLRRASGLPDEYGRECAQAVLIDAASGCGFFAENQNESER